MGCLLSCLRLHGDREAGATSGVAEFVLSKISNYLHVLYAMETTLREGNGGDEKLTQLLSIISSLIKNLEEISAIWMCIESGLEAGAYRYHYEARRIKFDSGKGRPRVVINQEKIEFLRELRFNWTQITEIFGVSRWTLYTVRSGYGMVGDE